MENKGYCISCDRSNVDVIPMQPYAICAPCARVAIRKAQMHIAECHQGIATHIIKIQYIKEAMERATTT